MTTQLDAALARLVTVGTLTEAQADAVRREVAVMGRIGAGAGWAAATPEADRGPAWRATLSEVGGYVGAAFVFAAIAALTGPNWDNLSRGTQISLLLGPSLLLLVAAVSVAVSLPGRWTPYPAAGAGARWRVVSALVVVAAVLVGAAGVVIVDGDGELAAASLPALAVVTLGYRACRTTLLHLAVAVAAMVSIYGAYDLGGGSEPAPAVTTLLLGVVWAVLGYVGVLAERTVGLVMGAVIAFTGAETLIVDDGDGTRALGYVALFAIAVAGLAGYMALRRVPLLVVGTATLAVAVPQAVMDYSEGALGAAGALLLSGLSIVAASVLGLRVRNATDEPSLAPH